MSAFWLLLCGAAVVIFGDVSEAGELPAGAAYLGCFLTTPSNEDPIKESSSMTHKLCINVCKEKGFRYSTLAYGRACNCGNSYSRNDKSPTDADCDSPCTGDKTEKCGGEWAKSVFSNQKAEEEKPPAKPPTLTAADAEYLGCYQASDSGEDFMTMSSAMTRTFCINLCKGKGFPYSALGAGRGCVCTKTYARNDKAPKDSDCNIPCFGDRTEMCGANWLMSIFSNQKAKDETPPAKPATKEVVPKYECTDETTKKTYAEGETWTTRHEGFCYHFKCAKSDAGVMHPDNTECQSSGDKCIAATEEGIEFNCEESKEPCQCKKEGGMAVKYYKSSSFDEE